MIFYNFYNDINKFKWILLIIISIIFLQNVFFKNIEHLINDKKYSGKIDYKLFKKAIDKKL